MLVLLNDIICDILPLTIVKLVLTCAVVPGGRRRAPRAAISHECAPQVVRDEGGVGFPSGELDPFHVYGARGGAEAQVPDGSDLEAAGHHATVHVYTAVRRGRAKNGYGDGPSRG